MTPRVSPFWVGGAPVEPARQAAQVISGGFVAEPISLLAGERQSVARVDGVHDASDPIQCKRTA
jgi:hypothetical protein